MKLKSSQLQFKQANHEDLNSILEIENRIFADPWNKNMFLSEMNSKISYTYLLKSKKTIIGYIIFWIVNKQFSHILNFGIDLSYQSQGFGSKLLQKYFDELPDFIENKYVECYLEVRESNTPAINLYKKFNFEHIGTRKKYYSDGENAILMKCTKKY